MNNQYPMKPMADALAKQGRGPDSMLMHVAPAEVAGIAALTGQQPTINPATGQPEGFVFLAPLLGYLGGAMGLGTLGTAALTGVGTAAITGDVKRGLVAGLTGGLASSLSGAGEVAEAADAAATVAEGADAAATAADAAAATTDVAATAANAIQDPNVITSIGSDLSTNPEVANIIGDTVAEEGVKQTGIGAFDAANQAATNKLGELSTGQQLLGTAIGSGQLAQMDYEDELRRQGRAFEDDREERLNRARNDLIFAQNAAQPGLGMRYMNRGGETGVDYEFNFSESSDPGFIPPTQADNDPTAPEDPPSTSPAPAPRRSATAEEQRVLDAAKRRTALSAADQAILEGYYSDISPTSVSPDASSAVTNPYIDYSSIDLGDIGSGEIGVTGAPSLFGGKGGPAGAVGGSDPFRGRSVSVQQGLRGQQAVMPPRDYRAGFEPEFNYYQSDPSNVRVPDRSYRPVIQGIESEGSYFEDVTKKMQDGGTVPLRTMMGESEVASGGLANIPTTMRADMPTKEEVQMVASALMGETERGGEIIEMFVSEYGPEKFRVLREAILSRGNPNMQTEGLIRGQGSGMDDEVMGMIGRSDPVAVSPGEFIIPADVVSGLGDGSTDAGSQELYDMMDRVRMGRGGTTKQARQVDPMRVLPA